MKLSGCCCMLAKEGASTYWWCNESIIGSAPSESTSPRRSIIIWTMLGSTEFMGPQNTPKEMPFDREGLQVKFESMLIVRHQPFESFSLDALRLQCWNVNQQFPGQFCAPKGLFLLTTVHWPSFLRYSDVCSWNASF